jgi:hypothetical protein
LSLWCNSMLCYNSPLYLELEGEREWHVMI